jgi:hypothetical protein
MKYFFHDILRSIFAPRRLYTEIHLGLRSPSWLFVALYCAIYMAYTIYGAFAGLTPPVEPLLKIELDSYYLVQSYYEAPLVFAMWILAAGIIHVLARFFEGKGDFDRTLRMTGYSLWVPWMILLPFDILPTSDLVYNLVLGICMLLMLAGTTIATEIEEGIEWGYAFLCSLVAILAISVLLFTMIR